MSLNISDTQRVRIWEVEDKGKYSVVKMGSSRKDKTSGEYKNTTWSFVRFVGTAHNNISEFGLKKDDVIVLKGANISQEPYMKDGEKKYPQNPQITVFNWQHYAPDEERDTPPVVEEEVPEFPF
jgi:hypothetical protein